ncbi:hypothetical protein B0H19DRAFT_1083114 [Mycena capillaripes]|nr:hypothetical protein B0H19DRAFT_1083114 [Mycena capillaripes]
MASSDLGPRGAIFRVKGQKNTQTGLLEGGAVCLSQRSDGQRVLSNWQCLAPAESYCASFVASTVRLHSVWHENGVRFSVLTLLNAEPNALNLNARFRFKVQHLPEPNRTVQVLSDQCRALAQRHRRRSLLLSLPNITSGLSSHQNPQIHTPRPRSLFIRSTAARIIDPFYEPTSRAFYPWYNGCWSPLSAVTLPHSDLSKRVDERQKIVRQMPGLETGYTVSALRRRDVLRWYLAHDHNFRSRSATIRIILWFEAGKTTRAQF